VDGWAGVVLDVVKRQHFVCIHCGSAFSVSGAA
jgi:transposase-like protein